MKKIFLTWILPILAPLSVIVTLLPVAAFPSVAFLPLIAVLFACGALAVSVAQSDNSVIQIALTLAAGIGVCFLFSSPTAGVALLCAYVPVGFSVGLVLRKKEPINSALFLSVFLVVVIILVGILAFTYETTGDLNVQKAMDNVTDTLSDDFDILYKMTDEAYDTEKNEFDFLTFSKSLAAHKDDIGETFPLSLAVSLRYIVTSPKDLLSLGKEAFMTGLLRNAVIVCAVAMPTLVLLVVALCYFVLKQILGLNQDPGELTMISTFRVDRTTAVLMPISFVTTLIALIIRDTGVFYTLSFAAESALSLVCGAAGISTIYYVMKNVAGKSKKRCRITAVVLGLLCRLTSFLETVISIIGAYDAFIDIRNRIKKGGDPE